ncbi:hypothetical protein J2848_002679 [Azospirillum lipoferum]|nr:hypothetical protein [Azospirillum lipoferum]
MDEALAVMSPGFERLYSTIGRPSIPQEKLLRALLLQAFYDQFAVWKGMVLGRSRSVIRRALAGLNQSD